MAWHCLTGGPGTARARGDLVHPSSARAEALCPSRSLKRLQKPFGHVAIASRQLVMRALARQQGPWTPLADAIERAAIRMFAIAVTRVAIPERTLRQIDLQLMVDDLYRVEDPRIISGPQPKANKRQGIGADNVTGRQYRRVGCPVADNGLPLTARRHVSDI